MRAYSPTKLTDNFFLGGATSLRGFGMWGTGPRQNGIVYMKLYMYITKFELKMAVFAHLTLGRTFCAI